MEPSLASMTQALSRPRPRERIIATAQEMFHQFGIRAVGVEAIAEAAGTNKMTLYRHFGSKDDLIVECLRNVAAEGARVWDQIELGFIDDPLAQLNRWIAFAGDYVAADHRGCDFINAAMEISAENHPARSLVEELKREHRERLTRLCAQTGMAEPELAADTLSLLLEGARISRQSVGAQGPSARFVEMAGVIVASFLRDNQSRRV